MARQVKVEEFSCPGVDVRARGRYSLHATPVGYGTEKATGQVADWQVGNKPEVKYRLKGEGKGRGKRKGKTLGVPKNRQQV